jgi:hypothetical protein
MKPGRYFKPGDTIPTGTTFIEYKNDIPKRAIIAKAEADSVVLEHYNGAIYELLEFDWPTPPPHPEIGEVWEVEFRETRERFLARYQGEKSKMQEVFGGEWLNWLPCYYKFIRRWRPDED